MSKKTFYISGLANYCYTTKVNTNGRFPSLCYEVGIIATPETPFIFDDAESEDIIKDYIKTSKDKSYDYLKIANSKYGYNMFDINAKHIEPVSIPNGTKIKLALSVKHSQKYDRDYLVCDGIQFLENIPDNNPFKK